MKYRTEFPDFDPAAIPPDLRNEVAALTNNQLWEIIRRSPVSSECQILRYTYAKAELRKRGLNLA